MEGWIMADIRTSSLGGIPFGNNAGRPANPIVGDTYYNGQIEALEIYNGTTWKVSKTEGFPPDTPTIDSVTDSSTSLAYSSTAGTLDVVMVPAATGGTATQYNAYTTTGGHSGFTTVGSTVTITGLTPGTAYTVYGNAQNGSGVSTNTENAAAVTPTTLPEVQTIGTATASTSANEVTVTWTNGSNGGKTLSAITITPFLNGATAETSRTAETISSTSYTFTQGQLTEGAAYTFKVKATNANGTSVDSTATNSATVPSLIAIDYLVVAGGGGGATANSAGNSEGGGGGGAGGLRSTLNNTGGGGSLESTLVLQKSTNYTVTVGAGATQVTAILTDGNNGSDSVFSTITATGGGGGGRGGNGGTGGSGKTGGSAGGGGAAPNGGTSGSRTSSPVQGNNGGAGAAAARAGGGGGAGAAGAAGNPSGTAGNGGNGAAVSITGTSVTYAGGGAGGAYDGSISGTGGTGGGGNGNTTFTAPGGNGGANLGGGGGGGGGGGSPQWGSGGAGGSGVVILRWLTSEAIVSVGAGLASDVTGTSGSYSYKRFTAGSGIVSFT